MSTEIFTIEELETIRIVMGERMKTLKNRIENFRIQDMTDEKKSKNIEKNEIEFSQIALIEAKAMREISNKILK